MTWKLVKLLHSEQCLFFGHSCSDLESLDENCRSLTQEQAVQVGLEMFGLLAARCVALLEEHLKSGELGVSAPLCTVLKSAFDFKIRP